MTLTDVMMGAVAGAIATIGTAYLSMRTKSMEVSETEKVRLMRRITELEERLDKREQHWEERERLCQEQINALRGANEALEDKVNELERRLGPKR